MTTHPTAPERGAIEYTDGDGHTWSLWRRHKAKAGLSDKPAEARWLMYPMTPDYVLKFGFVPLESSRAQGEALAVLKDLQRLDEDAIERADKSPFGSAQSYWRGAEMAFERAAVLVGKLTVPPPPEKPTSADAAMVRRKRMSRGSYEVMIKEDLEWLDAQPRTLEREHIRLIVQQSVQQEYGPAEPPPATASPEQPDRWLTECQQLYAAFEGSGHSPKNPREAKQAIGHLVDLGADRPECDATDVAHPAWWRGHDNGAKGMAELVERLRAELGQVRQDARELVTKTRHIIKKHGISSVTADDAEALCEKLSAQPAEPAGDSGELKSRTPEHSRVWCQGFEEAKFRIAQWITMSLSGEPVTVEEGPLREALESVAQLVVELERERGTSVPCPECETEAVRLDDVPREWECYGEKAIWSAEAYSCPHCKFEFSRERPTDDARLAFENATGRALKKLTAELDIALSANRGLQDRLDAASRHTAKLTNLYGDEEATVARLTTELRALRAELSSTKAKLAWHMAVSDSAWALRKGAALAVLELDRALDAPFPEDSQPAEAPKVELSGNPGEVEQCNAPADFDSTLRCTLTPGHPGKHNGFVGQPQPTDPEEAGPTSRLEVGQIVVVLSRGNWFGCTGEILRIGPSSAEVMMVPGSNIAIELRNLRPYVAPKVEQTCPLKGCPKERDHAGPHRVHWDPRTEPFPPLPEAPKVEQPTADTLRQLGWAVAVHNDYRLDGKPHTFWLFTRGERCAKGEGATDAEALAQVAAAIAGPKVEQPERMARMVSRVRPEHPGLDAEVEQASEGERCPFADAHNPLSRCPRCGLDPLAQRSAESPHSAPHGAQPKEENGPQSEPMPRASDHDRSPATATLSSEARDARLAGGPPDSARHDRRPEGCPEKPGTGARDHEAGGSSHVGRRSYDGRVGDGDLQHTCILTATTYDGRIPPPCKACAAQPFFPPSPRATNSGPVPTGDGGGDSPEGTSPTSRFEHQLARGSSCVDCRIKCSCGRERTSVHADDCPVSKPCSGRRPVPAPPEPEAEREDLLKRAKKSWCSGDVTSSLWEALCYLDEQRKEPGR